MDPYLPVLDRVPEVRHAELVGKGIVIELEPVSQLASFSLGEEPDL